MHLRHRQVFLFAHKVQVVGHGTLQREGEQLAACHIFVHGDFGNHRNASVLGHEVLDGFRIVHGGGNIQLRARQILLDPAQEFLLQRRCAAAGDDAFLSEELIRKWLALQCFKSIGIRGDDHQLGAVVMVHGIIRVHNLGIAEGKLKAARAQLVQNFRIVADCDVEAGIRMRALKFGDALGQIVAAGVGRGDDVDGVLVLIRTSECEQAIAVELEHLLGVIIKRLPVAAQLHGARGTVQQPRVQLGLEIPNMDGHHGLG